MTINERIGNNPYRILGVYVGSSLAKEASNKTRITAFSTVGQNAQFDFPIDEWLSPLQRTDVMAGDAVQVLSLPKDRVENALVWIGDGESEWSRELNAAVYDLLGNNWLGALRHYNTLFYNPEILQQFFEATTHGIASFSPRQLEEMVSKLWKDADSNEVLESFIGVLPEDMDNPLVLSIFEDKIIPIFPSVVDLTNIFDDDDDKDLYELFLQIKKEINRILPLFEMAKLIYGPYEKSFRELRDGFGAFIYESCRSIIVGMAQMIWKGSSKTLSGGFRIEWVATKFKPTIDAVVSMMREIKDFADESVDRLKLPSDSNKKTMEAKNLFDKKYADFCVPDPKALRLANLRYGLRQFGLNVIWILILVILYFFISNNEQIK